MILHNLRGIIFKNGQLVVMERWKNDQHFFVFPGGHLEKNETPEDCVKREILEEFGIVIEPVRLLYTYCFNENEHQGFFLCKWTKGKIHKTDAEEYNGQHDYNGKYSPTTIPLNQIENYNLLPKEIVAQLKKDIQDFGLTLDRETISIKINEA